MRKVSKEVSTRNSPGQQRHRIRQRWMDSRRRRDPRQPDTQCAVCGGWFLGQHGLASHERIHRGEPLTLPEAVAFDCGRNPCKAWFVGLIGNECRCDATDCPHGPTPNAPRPLDLGGVE